VIGRYYVYNEFHELQNACMIATGRNICETSDIHAKIQANLGIWIFVNHIVKCRVAENAEFFQNLLNTSAYCTVFNFLPFS
jgi:hypothetical protein